MTRAANLANFADETILTVDGANDRVGIGSTQPTGKLDISGDTNINGGNLFVTNGGLQVSGITTILGSLNANSTLDSVGILTGALATLGGLAVVKSAHIGNNLFVEGGAQVSGITTILGSLNANSTLDSTGIHTGALATLGGLAVVKSANIGGNLSVGGTITYEDVTNIDSVGVITARSDISIADKIVHTLDEDTNIRFPAANTFTVETGGSERFRIDSGGVHVADKIVHTLDEDTNIRFPAANTFTVETGGSERFRINSSGFVGVNTDSPGRQLTVSGGSAEGVIQITNNTSGAAGGNGFELLHFTSGETQLLNRENGAMRFDTNGTERLRITSAGAAIFKSGLAEKYENAGTTLGSQPNNPLSDGNVILFTGNESGNLTINFTGVHATLSNGETVSFTTILTPNNSGKITVAQVDGQAITIKWSGGSAPSAGSSGQDIYTFQILKTGTGTSDYTVFGAAANYA